MKRRRAPRISLRAKLLLLSVVLVVVPGLVFAWLAVGSTRRALEQAVGRQLVEVARDAADGVVEEIRRRRTDIAGWARQDLMREVRIADIDKRIARLLVSLRANDPAFTALLCSDARGRVVAASDPRWLGASLAMQPWWDAVSAGGEAVVGPIAALEPGQGRSVEIAAPILDPERPDVVIGALVGIYDWRRMDGVLQHLQHDLATLGLDVDLLLLDDAGVVIAGGWWEEPSDLAGRDLRAAGWRAAGLAGRATRPLFVREERARELVGVAPASEGVPAWTAFAVQPFDRAFAPARELRRTLLSALVAVLISGLALAAAIAERIGRPIRELTEATRELARVGEVRHPVAVRTHDEIGTLAASFNAMTAELERAREDLLNAAKLAFVGELAAGMTHEIRTPLGIVRSSAQILGRSLSAGDQRSAELVEMIVGEVDRLDRVVAGLLELARPHQPQIEATRLAPLLSRALDFLETQAREHGVVLRRDFTAGDRPASCDPDQIYQVVLNLVVNALQALSHGGTIAVRTFARLDRVGFEVSDDGPGMPPDVREKIFTPFFTRRTGGTGLGLAMVQRAVQAHHGMVSVESEPGRGATFRVELPVAEEGGA